MDSFDIYVKEYKDAKEVLEMRDGEKALKTVIMRMH